MNQRLIRKGTALILEGLVGKDWIQDENYEGTPERVARFYAEMFQPRALDVRTFPDDYKQMIVLAHHLEWTLCPHHLLPVELDVSLAYIPNGAVLGVSKLARLIQNHFQEPVLQEALTDSLVDELMCRPRPTPLGAGVVVRGIHDCMRIRGVHTTGYIVTSSMRGVFLEKPEVRHEFLSFVGVPNE